LAAHAHVAGVAASGWSTYVATDTGQRRAQLGPNAFRVLEQMSQTPPEEEAHPVRHVHDEVVAEPGLYTAVASGQVLPHEVPNADLSGSQMSHTPLAELA